ncbi:MAG: folylpolyglutamate synthase/dihydrofolate synthase family protein [Anaerolineae bacterium]
MDAYQETLDYIYRTARYGRHGYSASRYDLSRMRRILRRLGDPHRQLRCVHIAGTKGKGSTAAMCEAVLRSAGYRTGLFTSPHLHTFRERIRVDGRLIPIDDLVQLVEECRPALESEPDRTVFETITALAFVYFVRQAVDWVVIEVGMGGRLDATNVVQPDVCAITSLSLDHVDILGHTLSLIAWEKAGIIKPGIPVVTAPQANEAMNVIRQVCRDNDARLIRVGASPDADWRWHDATRIDLYGQRFSVSSAEGVSWPALEIPFLGGHQLANATVAIAVLAELQRRGVAIPEPALRDGLRSAVWPGRLEVLRSAPWIVVDSAHNVDSATKLALALRENFDYRRLCLVFGASQDKDIRGMLQVFLPLADLRIVSRSVHPRAADPWELAAVADEVMPGVPLSVTGAMEEAMTEALAWARPDDLVLVTGSIFAVAAARAVLAEQGIIALPADDWAYEADPVPVKVRR